MENDEAEESGGEFASIQALLAGALCLSAGAYALVTANRRRQRRHRRPVRMIASTPVEVAALEPVIAELGAKAQPDVESLDRALRHVAACAAVAGAPLPQVGAVVLGDDELTCCSPPLRSARPPSGGPPPTTLAHGC